MSEKKTTFKLAPVYAESKNFYRNSGVSKSAATLEKYEPQKFFPKIIRS